MTDRLTKQMVTKLLREKTAHHLCDSGGIYGRNYARNRKRKLADEEPVVLWTDGDGILITHRLWHWLVNTFEYDTELNRTFRKFARKAKYEASPWSDILEAFMFELDIDPSGIFGCNTANEDNDLDQDLQMWEVWDGEDTFYIFQVHGGCDLRSGYSSPMLFRGEYGATLNSHRDLVLACNSGEHNFFQEDTGVFYSEDSKVTIELYKATPVKDGDAIIGVVCPICGDTCFPCPANY